MGFSLCTLVDVANVNLITSRQPMDLPRFNKAIIQALQSRSRQHKRVRQEQMSKLLSKKGGKAMVRVKIVFYSMYGHIYKMAEAVAEGARQVEGAGRFRGIDRRS